MFEITATFPNSTDTHTVVVDDYALAHRIVEQWIDDGFGDVVVYEQ